MSLERLGDELSAFIGSHRVPGSLRMKTACPAHPQKRALTVFPVSPPMTAGAAAIKNELQFSWI
jgi:hypothetical protein